jgi:arginyl-tRNA---protein transferase
MELHSDLKEFAPRDHSKEYSIVYVIGESRSHCGYCGKSGKESSVSYGMHAESLTVYAYQSLLDRGWRRSGKWLYKPVHCKTCCQLLTIRLDVNKFEESTSQKRVRRRWASFLGGNGNFDSSVMQRQDQEGHFFEGGSPKRPREDDFDGALALKMQNTLGQTKRQKSNVCLTSLDSLHDNESPSLGFSEKLQMESVENDCKQNESKSITDVIASALNNAVTKLKQIGNIPNIEYPYVVVRKGTEKQRKVCGKDLVFTSNVALAIAGKAKAQGIPISAEDVADYLLNHLCLDINSLYIKRVHGHLNIYSKGEEIQNNVKCHQPRKNLDPQGNQGVGLKSKHEFNVVTVPSSDSQIPEVEFELFRKYQTIHHKDDPESVTVESFKRFLCESPLISVPPDNCRSIPSSGYGSFHQQYWLDGELVAVGVIDVLPKCLSSKYFFWDPNKAKLSLGTLASLFEIDWIKMQSQIAPDLKYYYLGYYLHNCHRMRYKASFSPSELLCPTSYEWVDISSICSDLDSGNPPWNLYNRGTQVREENETNAVEDVDEVNLIIPFHGGSVRTPLRTGKVIKFGALRKMGLLKSCEANEHLKIQIKEWMNMVGPVWESMLYAV